jgi:biopolymer transport protein ExbB
MALHPAILSVPETPSIEQPSCAVSRPATDFVYSPLADRYLEQLIDMPTSLPNPRTLVLVFLVGCSFSASGSSQGPIDAPDAPTAPIDSRPDAPPDGPRTDWWNASWGHRRLITIDTSKLSAGLSGYPLNGFPVLVKLTPQTIDYTTVKPDGSDLRFVLPDNTTVLPYDIDTFASGGTSLIWVRIPALTATASQTLFVYHGNASATAVASGAGVFAATHVSVHHLGADYSDVTGHAHTGTQTGTPSAIPDGQLGGARRFNGSTDYISLAGENAYDFTTTLTVSAWVRVATFNLEYQAIVTKGDKAWRIHRENLTRHLGFGTTNANNNDNQEGTTNLDNNQWHQVAIVYDAAKKLIYVDGVQEATRNYTLTIDQNNELVAIGHNSQSTLGGERFWNGDIDEVRISDAARAPAWIGAEYVTATSPMFVTLGPDQPY